MREISKAKFISRVKRRTSMKKTVVAVLVLLILQFIAVEGLIVLNGRSDAEIRTDYLIIPGAGLNGRVVSPSLESRLDAGLLYLQKFPDVKVVVSGGQGKGEDITEAEAMREFLVANGIAEDRIMIEPNATSTMENFSFSKAVIEQQTGDSVSDITFVTNSFHVLRAKMLAGRSALSANAIVGDTLYVDPLLYFREYFALIKSFIFDR